MNNLPRNARPWRSGHTFETWYQEWVKNYRIERNLDTALQLLHSLPEIALLPWGDYRDETFIIDDKPFAEQKLRDWFTGLYIAIHVVEMEQEPSLIVKANRAVQILLKDSICKYGRVQSVCEKYSFMSHENVYWQWPWYRMFPIKVLHYFASAKSYGFDHNLYMNHIHNWLKVLLNVQEGKVCIGGYGCHWPDLEVVHRNDFLRTIILDPQISLDDYSGRYQAKIAEEMVPFADDIFELLLDARNSHLIGSRANILQSKQVWPKFTDSHYNRIMENLFFLGFVLNIDPRRVQTGSTNLC